MSTGELMPESMSVSVLDGPGKLRLEERPVPVPGPGEVLVRIASVGVCGSDTHYYHEGRIGSFVVESPLVLGHEASGRIEAAGDGVDPSLVGQRVSLEPGIPQPYSAQTLAGHYNLDPDVRFFATPPVDGAFAEYVVHPAAFAHPVPENLSDDAAALLEPLSVALAARAAGEVQLGDRVLVAGAGPIGLLVSAVCALAGAEVTVTDVRAERLQAAPRYGAAHTFTVADAPESVPEYQVFIDATGAEPAVLAGMQRLAPRGRCVLVGMGADTIALPVPLVQGRELRITGTFRYANTWPLAISLAGQGLVDLDGLVTSRHGLDGVEAALVAGAREGALKAVVVP
ncbi:NAD(P)-dependent alcohol dehydrogenase [Arthrobacter sp. BL-252-APC-1A]|uniref:NAD(P)-dependent alcohol dehydrogenase n=1 Tax=Arthrobacter sp. BL-252-APC-1A TaxID=2606622 RepID=UPI0012B281B6|nr:NAD(P)-dependent alcohol dehydrogenase [Arthrobacter sp. BL-252-APC-1A]MSR99945.1 NAD(P)-dependent alcohol dehydrogenase [Arthrobacter sp. BL-252-APC-1A]